MTTIKPNNVIYYNHRVYYTEIFPLCLACVGFVQNLDTIRQIIAYSYEIFNELILPIYA